MTFGVAALIAIAVIVAPPFLLAVWTHIVVRAYYRARKEVETEESISNSKGREHGSEE